jgi:hypothetical protein
MNNEAFYVVLNGSNLISKCYDFNDFKNNIAPNYPGCFIVPEEIYIMQQLAWSEQIDAAGGLEAVDQLESPKIGEIFIG